MLHTHTRTEGFALVLGFEFTTIAASLQGDSAEIDIVPNEILCDLTDCVAVRINSAGKEV